uniref:Piezo transmembrane helical unit domain-containing protein n=1 Tax=Globodera rostochiensis TaxID=31243 RepID=A0A914HWQ4_GLORO
MCLEKISRHHRQRQLRIDMAQQPSTSSRSFCSYPETIQLPNDEHELTTSSQVEIQTTVNRRKQLDNIAVAALEFQPMGYTLETTEVKTITPFLLRGDLREYQLVGHDWLGTLYEKTKRHFGGACPFGLCSCLGNGAEEVVSPALKVLTYFGTAKERAEKRKGPRRWMSHRCGNYPRSEKVAVGEDEGSDGEKSNNWIAVFVCLENFPVSDGMDFCVSQQTLPRICYCFVVIVHGYTAGLLTLPLPALVFFWGTLASPRPSKLFWIVMCVFGMIIYTDK